MSVGPAVGGLRSKVKGGLCVIGVESEVGSLERK